jgi:uncharacterized protein (TIGR02466 family)
VLEARRARDPLGSAIARRMKSAQGLYESGLDLFESEPDPTFQALVDWIRERVRRAAWHANGEDVSLASVLVELKDAWFHVANDGGFHDAHQHAGCSWCGIYYLQADLSRPQAGAPNGVNRFYSPLATGGGFVDYGSQYLRHSVIDVLPVPGTLVLFPAHLMHSALPYRGLVDRVVISFNAAVWLEAPG